MRTSFTKRVVTLFLAALLCLSLAGCSADTQEEAPPIDMSYEELQGQNGGALPDDITAEMMQPLEQKFTFAVGSWISSTDGLDRTMYFFDNDIYGSTADLTDRMGVPFSYETPEDGRLIFHFGGVDVNNECEYELVGDDTVRLKYEDHTEELRFISPDTDSVLVWHSNEELEQLAVGYYATLHDAYQPQCVGSMTNEDGSVSIQLYDSLEDHISTCAWYTVDRFTGQGTDDMTQEKIDITFGSAG